MKRFFFPLVFLLICLLLVHQPALAQAGGMNLTGSVQSETRESLAGAAITVIHLPSGVRHAVASDGTGHFAIANLMVGGSYLIRVGEGGYHSQTVENIFLETGKTANFTVTLNQLAPGETATTTKSRPSRPTDKGLPALASQAEVGGPVLLTAPAPVPTAVLVPAAAALVPTAVLVPTAAAPAPRPARYGRTTARRLTAPVPDPIVPGHYDTKTGNYVYETGPVTSLKLPGGGVIAAVGQYSTESNLHRFLADPQVAVDTVDLTRGWYNFDRVFFDPGKATLTPESLRQLRNVALLLRAYPTARIKLGGYTDSTGSYKVNKLLSEARARTAWAHLIEMGISPARVDARGYGPRYAIAPNATEEGRAMNRRLSVKVLQK